MMSNIDGELRIKEILENLFTSQIIRRDKECYLIGQYIHH